MCIRIDSTWYLDRIKSSLISNAIKNTFINHFMQNSQHVSTKRQTKKNSFEFKLEFMTIQKNTRKQFQPYINVNSAFFSALSHISLFFSRMHVKRVTRLEEWPQT